MSRLEFRVAVDLPRPRAAFALVGLASATLAITGQLQLWALALAVGALAWAALRNARPAPWQRSRLALNFALGACLAAAVVVDRLGGSVLVSLAHFALLAQALQLLDARARRSEFLLVALAIFQVTLAANLTDSVFFPPLLVAFTVAVVWTLIVHTLRAEALEAGEPEAARQALSRGLLRTTSFASLCCVGLALALFPLLPRVRSGAIFDKGFGFQAASSGFSEHVELGDIGRIRLDPTRVMRVTTLEGPVASADERYWRGLAFDRFDGRRWSVTPSQHTPVHGDAEIGVDLGGPRRRGKRVVQQIAREEIASAVLFTPGLPAGFRGAVGRLERDANRSLHAPHTAGKRVLYHVVADLAEPRAATLAEERVASDDTRYLQLPPLDPRIVELAQQLVAGAPHDAARVLAIERWLRTNGRYTDAPPDFGDERSPVEKFLLERTEGHCEYFASGMVILLRSAGLPARIVNGFAGGHANELGGFLEVAQSDAHTWVEVPYEESGWVRHDPTPPDLRLAGAAALREGAGWSELASAVELWWFRNVVDFDRGHQARAVRSAWLAWHRWRKDARAEAEDAAPADDALVTLLPTAPLWGLAAVLAFAGWAASDLRRRRRRARARIPRTYARALRLLARRGHRRGESETARGFADAVASRVSPAAAHAFAAITDAYLAHRFGGAPSSAAPAELRTLRDSLRA